MNFPCFLDPDANESGSNYGVLSDGVIRIPRLFLILPSRRIAYVSEGYDEEIKEKLSKKLVLANQKGDSVSDKLAVYFTNSTNSYMESCDCPANPYGGLVRLSTFLKKEKEMYADTLLLDSGDFFKPYISDELANKILRIYQLLQYLSGVSRRPGAGLSRF